VLVDDARDAEAAQLDLAAEEIGAHVVCPRP